MTKHSEWAPWVRRLRELLNAGHTYDEAYAKVLREFGREGHA